MGQRDFFFFNNMAKFQHIYNPDMNVWSKGKLNDAW